MKRRFVTKLASRNIAYKVLAAVPGSAGQRLRLLHAGPSPPCIPRRARTGALATMRAIGKAVYSPPPPGCA